MKSQSITCPGCNQEVAEMDWVLGVEKESEFSGYGGWREVEVCCSTCGTEFTCRVEYTVESAKILDNTVQLGPYLEPEEE